MAKTNKRQDSSSSRSRSKGSRTISKGASSSAIKSNPSSSTDSTRRRKEGAKGSLASLPLKKPGSGGSRPTAAVATVPSSAATSLPTSKLAASSKGKQPARVLSDEESQNSSDADDDGGEEEEDPDRQLGLRPTLRVVSKATVRRSWKPVNVKMRTHIQSLVSGLFPMNDTLSELNVPTPGKDRPNYSQLTTRNRELEAMLVPDLEHIRDLELRLEQEQILAEQDKEQLESFKEKKKALDSYTAQLHRQKLHPLLREPGSRHKAPISKSTMATLCMDAENRDYKHLSAADQRLLAMMPTSRQEDFSGAEIRNTTYNPDQDPKINKFSKRLGTRLSSIEQNGAGLDPVLQLILAAQDRVRELSGTVASGSNSVGHGNSTNNNNSSSSSRTRFLSERYT
ncbi:hypothetical protein EDD11_009293 [Mortierella claussenii]|nr:hypothetical protein EDD11_009293 [Mortierella claussenii]